METKLVKAPFDIDLAKKITNGEIEGKIVTRDGRNVRIVCFDAKMEDNIVALIESEEGVEFSTTFNYFGQYYDSEERPYDLFLEIPEYLTFKDGDVLYCDNMCFIYSGEIDDYGLCGCYCSLIFTLSVLNLDFDFSGVASETRLATESEKQRLIDALKESTDERAKECLKMLSIENTPKLSNSSKIGKKEEQAKEAIEAYMNMENISGPLGSFKKGFFAGWDACMKYLSELPWDEAMNEIVNNCKKKED